MRKFIKILGLGIGAANIPAFASAQEVKPNILWIIADDLGTDLACYGNNIVKTPNTDRLASEGITFTGLFSVTAVSSPSRSSLMTGMYPVSIDCHQHRTLKKMPLPEGVLPVTDYFRKAGYWVANGDGTRFGRAGKTDFNFEFQAKTMFDGPDWTGRKQDQPFFVQMQIHYPHRPFEPDKLNPIDPASVTIPPVYPDHPVTRADWAQYLESVQHADEAVGSIMERLEKDGLLDNTIVMFFGDQGRPMVRAKQFVYDEGTNTPLIIRFPDKRQAGTRVDDLISNIDIPATSLALAGLELPGKMQGRNIFSKKKREFVFTSRDRMDETVDRIRAVRNERFKYIRNYYPDRPYTQFNTYKVTMYPVLTLMKVLYKRGELNPAQAIFMGPGKEKEELYDLRSDPYEMKNLATDPAFSKDLKKLRKAIDKWVAEADKGLYPESVAETDYWKDDASRAYIQKMKSYGLPADISDEDYLKWWEKNLLKTSSKGRTFYINSITGNDANSGLSINAAWKTLEPAGKVIYAPGDKLLLCGGCTFHGKLELNGGGDADNRVLVSSYNPGETKAGRPVIDAKGYLAAIQIRDGKNFEINDLELVSDGGDAIESAALTARYGVLVTATRTGVYPGIILKNLYIHHIFSTVSVKDEGANPTSNRGMGIGIFMEGKGALIKDIRIENSSIEMTGHTGIRINGNTSGYLDGVNIINNRLKNIGGPGMVPSRCQNVVVSNNVVDHSGYSGDPRIHARGSGIWPWTCNNVLIEKNKFMHARGRNDSHGVHIDFNCKDVVVQYNLMIDNEGGFVEILGNNTNCTYRYNISINDGSRIRGVNGANAPGRAIWIFGYAGSGNKRTGPFNSYIYNNTIYVKEEINSGFTFDTTASGIFIANNIFYMLGKPGNFNVGKSAKEDMIPNVVFNNNLYNKADLLPASLKIKDRSPLTGDPEFRNPGGTDPEDYIPANVAVIKDKGIKIGKIPGDDIGLRIGLEVKTDFFGNPIKDLPDIGAIEIN